MKVVTTGVLVEGRIVGLARHDEKARHVVRFVLDILAQHIEAVEFGGQRRGDGGDAGILQFGDVTGRTGGVVPVLRRQLELADDLAALAQRRALAHHGLDAVQRRTLQAQKLMAHAMEMLADDVEPGIGQEMMDVGDAAMQRVLDRDNRQIGLAVAHRRDRILEGGTGNGLGLRQGLARGQIGIGPGLALKGDAPGPRHQCCHLPTHAFGLG